MTIAVSKPIWLKPRVCADTSASLCMRSTLCANTGHKSSQTFLPRYSAMARRAVSPAYHILCTALREDQHNLDVCAIAGDMCAGFVVRGGCDSES